MLCASCVMFPVFFNCYFLCCFKMAICLVEFFFSSLVSVNENRFKIINKKKLKVNNGKSQELLHFISKIVK